MLPEGAVVDLRVVTDDGMIDEEREALHASIEARINGYRVYVLPGHEADAALVKEQLGSIANVWFSPYFKIVSHGAARDVTEDRTQR